MRAEKRAGAPMGVTVLLGVVAACLLIALVVTVDLRAGAVEAEATKEAPTYTAPELFDVSCLEGWCGSGGAEGTIRMVSGWRFGTDNEGNAIIEDETGELWAIGMDVGEEDFLLLWIADNHTKNYEKDDIIIKVWKELAE